MLYKTRGVVINYVKYGETSIIVKIFTELFGIQSYIVNGARSKKGNKIAFYQPLTLLELVVYHKQNAQIFRIAEIRCSDPFTSIPGNHKKSCIAIFITEILNKTLKGETEPDLFNFIHQSILILENLEDNFENFHLQFLLKLSKYIGFAPETEKQILEQVGYIPLENDVLNEQALLKSLLVSEYNNIIKINNRSRRKLLDLLIQYYSLQIENFGEVRSIQVLKELLE
jgi:DNA repair protein RecO (recombination protein O)